MHVPRRSPPSPWLTGLCVAVGVALPVAAIAVELAAHLGFLVFIDPLPSLGHVALAGAVPAAVAAGLLGLHGRAIVGGRAAERALAFGFGAGAAFCVVLWPLVLAGAIGAIAGWAAGWSEPDVQAPWVLGLAWLALAPATGAFAAALTRFRVRRRAPGTRFDLGWAVLGMIALGFLELPLQRDLQNAPTLEWTRGLVSEGQHLRAHDLPPRQLGTALILGGGPLARRPERLRTLELFRATGRLRGELGALRLPGADAPNADRLRSLGLEPWGDRLRGGFQVGWLERGLALERSSLAIDVHGGRAFGYAEWTWTLANRAGSPLEARAVVELPAGGVVSRATLWVAGVPREASFGGRERVTEAYQNVVATRRDPLLVTAHGDDAVFVNAFPVPAEGEMTLRFGITFPLAVAEPGHAAGFLPRLGERNFGVPPAGHGVRLRSLDGSRLRLQAREGSPPVPSPDTGWTIGDRVLARGVVLDATGGSSSAGPLRDLRSAGAPGLRQSVDAVPMPADEKGKPGWIVVLDGSKALDPHRATLATWLEGQAASDRMQVILSGDTVLTGSSEEIARQLRSHRLRGGHDPLPALARAAAGAEGRPVLWIHGPQPRRGGVPDGPVPLWLTLPLGPGPDPLPDLPRANRTVVPWTGDLAADLARLDAQRRRGVAGWVARVTRAPEPSGTGREPEAIHLARLLARREALDAGAAGRRAEALALGTRYELVSPWTGAVVLERDAEYARAGLAPPARDPDDPGADDVVTRAAAGENVVPRGPATPVPEPGAALLFGVAALALRWLGRRGRLG